MSTAKKFLSLLLVLALLCAPVGMWYKRYDIADWWRLRGYAPAPRIAKLATDSSMNDYGTRLFYVHDPQLNDKADFNDNCKIPEATIVLGCYVSNLGIYVLDVHDERLAGIHEVTAAHEMLHAAYDRLGGKDKERVNELLQAAFTKITDERIKKTIEGYKARDATIVNNELHSILGTEVRDVGAELEAYYGNYFEDRGRIVQLSEQYEGVFTDIENKVSEYDEELQLRKERIEILQASLDSQVNSLSSEKDRLDGLMAFGDRAAYNAAVPGYNAMVRQYNADLQTLKDLIDQYNELVNERNSLALEQRELLQAIDSRSIPQAP